MPLDLFSIARGLKAGQDAYTQGQKEQADKYWSDIENSLKVVASAQELKQATELGPFKQLSEQALEYQRRKSGEYSGARTETEEALREPSVKLKEQQTFSAEQLGKAREIKAKTDQQILDALQSGYSKFQVDNPDSKASYNEWLYQNYPNLGPASEKAKEAVKTQGETTRLRTAQAMGAEQKVTTGTEERKAYETLGTTPGAVVAGTEIAQMEKAKSDAEISAVKEKYADQQAKATLDATQARAEKSAETGGYKVSQWADDVGIIDRQIDTLNNRNALINKSLAYLSKSSSIDQFIQGIAAQNNIDLMNVAGQVADATSLESAKKALLDDKRANTERISFWIGRKNQLNRLAGMPEEPTIQVKPVAEEPTEKQTIEVPYSDFNSWTKEQKDGYVRTNANMGTRRIEFTDSAGMVYRVMDIKESTNVGIYDFLIKDAKGKLLWSGNISKTSRKQSNAKPTPKPAVQAKPTQAPNKISPQGFVQSLRSKGINSINQLEPDIIQALKAQGIYDQVLKLLGE